MVLEHWAKERSVNLTILRVFHVFGEREMEKRLWPTLVKSALTDRDLDLTAGQQIREFIYVKDVAEEFIRQSKSISSSNLGFKVINLGTKRIDPKDLHRFGGRCLELNQNSDLVVFLIGK